VRPCGRGAAGGPSAGAVEAHPPASVLSSIPDPDSVIRNISNQTQHSLQPSSLHCAQPPLRASHSIPMFTGTRSMRIVLSTLRVPADSDPAHTTTIHRHPRRGPARPASSLVFRPLKWTDYRIRVRNTTQHGPCRRMGLDRAGSTAPADGPPPAPRPHGLTLCLLRDRQLRIIRQQWLGQGIVWRPHCREPCGTGERPGRRRSAAEEVANPALVSATHIRHCKRSHW
jgi:hypothetical protein